MILKTDGILPYTSVFMELDCGYWDGERESALRESMDAGYRTHFIGKWHLGAPRYGPEHQGFDNVVVSGGAAAGYFSPYKFLPAASPPDRTASI